LGWALITHPFHPFRGERFPILKNRRVSGIDTLILRGSVAGTFAVPVAWTDRAPPSREAGGSHAPRVLDGGSLLQLAGLIDCLNPAADKRVDE
jgi:hypothetical protein